MKKVFCFFGLFFVLIVSVFSQTMIVTNLKFGMTPQEASIVIGKTLIHTGNDITNPWYYAEDLSDGTKFILMEITKEDGLVGFRLEINPMTYNQAKDHCQLIVDENSKTYGNPRITTNNNGMLITIDPITGKRTEYGRPVYYAWNFMQNNSLGEGIATITVTVTQSQIEPQQFTVETLYQSIIQYNQIQSIINNRR